MTMNALAGLASACVRGVQCVWDWWRMGNMLGQRESSGQARSRRLTAATLAQMEANSHAG